MEVPHCPVRSRRERSRLADGDAGFTLIELLVVLFVLGVLLAIAIPSFLSVTKGAGNTVTKSDVIEALQTEKEYYVSNQSFTQSVSTLKSMEPGIDWVTSGNIGSMSLQSGQVGVQAVDANSSNAAAPDGVIIAGLSATGTCYFLGSESIPGTYAQGDWYTESTGNANGVCSYPTQIASLPVSSNPPKGPGTPTAWGDSWG